MPWREAHLNRSGKSCVVSNSPQTGRVFLRAQEAHAPVSPLPQSTLASNFLALQALARSALVIGGVCGRSLRAPATRPGLFVGGLHQSGSWDSFRILSKNWGLRLHVFALQMFLVQFGNLGMFKIAFAHKIA